MKITTALEKKAVTYEVAGTVSVRGSAARPIRLRPLYLMVCKENEKWELIQTRSVLVVFAKLFGFASGSLAPFSVKKNGETIGAGYKKNGECHFSFQLDGVPYEIEAEKDDVFTVKEADVPIASIKKAPFVASGRKEYDIDICEDAMSVITKLLLFVMLIDCTLYTDQTHFSAFRWEKTINI